MATPTRKEHRLAMLVSPGDGVYLGGREFFHPTEPTVHLCWANPVQADPYIGFEIHIPTDNLASISTSRDTHRTDVHVVGAFFFQDVISEARRLSNCPPNFQSFLPTNEDATEWFVVTIKGTSTPQKWPMPFFGVAEYLAWMEDRVIKGQWRLSSILAAAGVFHLIVKINLESKGRSLAH